ncbi:MAG: cell division protein ZapA [Acidobacteria bacterium]|nr:cell division protein ZapA [Acidobacteriota bacterium]MBI3473113.1 cell division protein ZapA [Candidatus Solibacter usitatus]
MEPAAKRSVRVTLLGQPYSLVTQGEPVEVERLAQQVDILMHDIARKLPNADSTKIAVLACMHLADRLHSLEQDLTTLKERVGRKSEQFVLLLDQALEP